MPPSSPHPLPHAPPRARDQDPPLVRPRPAPREPLELRFTDRDRPDIPRIELPPGHLTLVEGRTGTEAMRHRLVIDCALQGGSVMHLVASNRLDSTGLARRAQAQGLDPAYVLNASTIARGFTAYQFSVLVEDRLPHHLDEEPTTKAALVLDPLALYTDEDVRRQEGTQLVEHAVASLRETAHEHALPLVLVQPPRPARRPSPGRRGPSPNPSPQRIAQLLSLLQDSADEHVRVHPHEGSPQGSRSRTVELPRDDRRVRLAEPPSPQARLDRFLEEGIAHG